MEKRYLSFTVFVVLWTSTMTFTIANRIWNQSLESEYDIPQSVVMRRPRRHRRHFKRTCPELTQQMRSSCVERASNQDKLNDDVDDDLDFFKKCIVDYYCFEKSATADVWVRVPTFESLLGTPYFNNVAKRVEIFFIRNNDWSTTRTDPKLRNPNTGVCTNLLYVIAARYLYVIYVLDQLRDELSLGPCRVETGTGNLVVPANGVCYPAPHGNIACSSDFDVALIGARSGSMTALFNQFFRETLGRDPVVAGFGKTSEQLFDTNIYAFTMEHAMPSAYAYEAPSTDLVSEMNILNTDINYIVQEVVSAILKMRQHNRRFFNDLLSDQVELNKRPTKNNLGIKFHEWVVSFSRYADAVRRYRLATAEISFRRIHNAAYEVVLGMIEKRGESDYRAKALAQVVIAVLYRAETYQTRGAIRHVVGWTQMRRQDIFDKISVNDYWVSMLENWADTVKEYNRECRTLIITACLPRMSKYFWRMLDAMYAARSRLTPELRKDLIETDTPQNDGLRSIMSHWLIDVKKKGLEAIPLDDRLPSLPVETTNLDVFLQTFGCDTQQKTTRLSRDCLSAIHLKVRKYNRMLFANLMNVDSAVRE